MRKVHLVLMVWLVSMSIGANAQISGYSFTPSAGTYSDIVGGTPVSTSISVADFLGDTKTSAVIPIGFSFTFNNIAYSSVVATSDGFLSFNPSATSTLSNNLSTSTAARRPLVAPLWDDLDGASGSGAANCITTGAPGSQVFTIEWKNWQWNYAATGATVSFQVKLYEGTNEIEFIYRSEAGSVNNGSASIGIAGVATGSGNFLSLSNATSNPSVSSTSETTNISAKPATGQIYKFSPPAPCLGQPSAGTLSVLSQNICPGSTPAAITATGYSSGSGLTFQWEESDDNGVSDPWANAVGGTGATTASYTPPSFGGTAIYYRLNITCTNGGMSDQTASSVVNPAGTPGTPATLVNFTSVTNTGMTINWTNGTGGRRYVVINSTNSFTDPVDGTTGPVVAGTTYTGSGEQIVYDGTGTSVSIGGLACNTTYYARVYEYQRCGSAVPYNYYFNVSTTAANPASQATIAPATALLPDTNDFAGFTGSNLPAVEPGWYEAGATASSSAAPTHDAPPTSNSVWASSTGLGITTAKVNLYTNTRNAWIISPIISLTSPSRVKFKAAITDFAGTAADPAGMQGTDDKVYVLVSTDGCGATWTVIDSFYAGNTTSLTNALTDYNIPLTGYTNQAVQIAFQATDGPTDDGPDYDFHIGNIIIEPVPACDAPTALNTPVIGSGSVTVDWTAPAVVPSGGYEYYVSATNTAPTASSAASGSVPSGNSVIISGLSPATTYYVWVRSVCGTTSSSSWTGPITFTTACAVLPAPFAESFNSATLPACWTNTGTETWDFALNGAGGPDYGAETATDHTGNAGYFAWADDSSPNNVGIALTSPIIDISTLTTPRLRFYFWSYDSQTTPENGSLVVKANNGSGWVTIDSIYQNFTAQWNERTISLAAFAPGNVQLQFIVNENASNNFYNDILLDDIFVENTPTCPTPAAAATSNLTSTSADLVWTSAASQFEIEYGLGNFVLGTGTRTIVGASPYPLSGLTPTTSYSFFVRAVCAPGDTSIWSSRVSFSTTCPAFYSMPFSENFSAYVPACWSEQTGYLTMSSTLTGTTSGWTNDDWLNTTTNGDAAKINLYNASKNDWMITPSIDLGTGGTAQLEFDLAFLDFADSFNLNLGSDDTVAVVISTDNGLTWSLSNALQIWTASNSSVASQHVVIPLTAFSGTIKIGFYGSEGTVNDPNDVDVMIDNVLISGTPLAIDLGDIKAINVDNRNRVDWNTVSEKAGDYFQLERSADAVDFTELTTISANAQASSYTYWDEGPLDGVNYYRLRMYDASGKFTTSRIVSATARMSASFTVEVYPNPVANRINVERRGSSDANAIVQVTDVSGRVLRSVSVTEDKTTIDLSGLSSGVYLIRYSDNSHQQTFKINKL